MDSAFRNMKNCNQSINRSNIQSQFNSIIEEKKKLHSLVISIDHERNIEEIKLRKLRTTYHSMMEQIRVASSNLGTKEQKKVMLQNEIQRLQRNMERDKEVLKDVSQSWKVLEQNNIRDKNQFIKEMDALNEQMVDSLKKYEEGKLMKLLNLNVCLFVADFLRRKVESQTKPPPLPQQEEEGQSHIQELEVEQQAQDNDDAEEQQQQHNFESNNNDDHRKEVSVSDDENRIMTNVADTLDYDSKHYNVEGTEKWEFTYKSLQDAVTRLTVSHQDLANAKQGLKNLEQKAIMLRIEVKKGNIESLGEKELDKLENLWQEEGNVYRHSDGNVREQMMETDDCMNQAPQDEQTTGMKLFYGNIDELNEVIES